MELEEVAIHNKLTNIFLNTGEEALYDELIKFIVKLFTCKFGLIGKYTGNKEFIISSTATLNPNNNFVINSRSLPDLQNFFSQIPHKLLEEKKNLYVMPGDCDCFSDYPELAHGHITPIIYRSKMIGIICVFAEKIEFTQQDCSIMQTIADQIAPLATMQREVEAEKNKRRIAEETLTAYGEFHKKIFSCLEHLVFITDLYGNFLNIYGNIFPILGYTAEELYFFGNLQKLTGEEFTSFFNTPQDVEVHNFHCSIPDKHKEIHHFLVNIKKVPFHDGSFIFGFNEITELKRTTEALRENEFLFRHFFNNISSGAAVYQAVDGGSNFIFRNINRTTEENYGIKNEDVFGKKVTEVFPSISSIGLLDVFRRVWETGLAEYHPITFYSDNRIAQWVQNFVFPLPSGEIAAVFDDISEQIGVKEEKIKNERKLRLLLESTCTVPWEFDPIKREFTFMGKQIETILGYPVASWISLNSWSDRLHDKDKEKAVSVFENVLTTGKDQNLTYRAIHADGSIKWIQDIVTVVCDSHEKEKLVGFKRDITALKKAEDEENKLELRLRHAQKMETMGTMTGGIVHDFNNILASIIGYADLMAEDAPPGTQLASDLQQILKAGHKAKSLVQQILSFSRQSKVERIAIKLNPLIKETLQLLRSTVPTTIEIRQEICSEELVLLADPTQIHQIMMNLCTNAYHAMEKTGGILRITLRKKTITSTDLCGYPHLQKGLYAELGISDTGMGIPAEIKPKIFEPYFTTKEQGKGTGLGLAIAHRIATEYGGTITVNSIPGKGASFHVFLPLSHDAPMLYNAVAPSKHDGGTERILLIDDEESLLKLGEKILTKLGYKVMTCQSSVEALRIFSQNPLQYDLVITDQTMPNLTGAELAMKMMEIRPDIPVILCTGYTNLINASQAKTHGIREFVMKPLVPAEMAMIVKKTLHSSKQ